MRVLTRAGGDTFDRQHLLVAAAILAVVALAGCSLLADDSGQRSLPTGEEAAEQYRSLDGYEATLHYEYTDRADRRSHIEVDIDGGRSRVEWLTPDSIAGNINVYNGSTLVRYNATTNEFVRIGTEDLAPFEAGADEIATVVDSAREDGETTVEGPPAGGAPLPAVPAGEDTENAPESDDNSRFNVTYEGTETVAGREAYVIDYQPVGDPGDGVVEQTVWLDTEYFITLKSRQVTRRGGEKSTFTFRMSDVTIDPDFEEDTFAFDPPSGATLNESNSYDLTSYRTIASLSDVAALSVPDPTVPDRFALDRANHIRGSDFAAVQLRYRAASSLLFVTKTTEDDYTNLSRGDPVSIGDRTGRYRSSGTRALVAWQCDGHVYTVTADISKAELLDVARSVECD